VHFVRYSAFYETCLSAIGLGCKSGWTTSQPTTIPLTPHLRNPNGGPRPRLFRHLSGFEGAPTQLLEPSEEGTEARLKVEPASGAYLSSLSNVCALPTPPLSIADSGAPEIHSRIASTCSPKLRMFYLVCDRSRVGRPHVSSTSINVLTTDDVPNAYYCIIDMPSSSSMNIAGLNLF
jgi:hypothetical protein